MSPRPMTNDDFNLSLFIKLMKMTTASFDGEALAAMRKANAMLKDNGHDWEALLKGKITIVNDPFGSIPETAKPQAAPPPPPKPAHTPRLRRDPHEVSRWIATLHASRHLMRGYRVTRLDQIVIDWQHHSPNMTAADHAWLQLEVQAFTPQVRNPDLVQQFFDTCDFAPLSTTDSQRVVQIRVDWNNRGDNKMIPYDYDFLEQLHRIHSRPAKGRGKAKRLF